MKTKLPEIITTIDEAKTFLSELHSNNEHFHPEDDATDIDWDIPEPSTEQEAILLNKLMADIYDLTGNDGRHVDLLFDPCEWLTYLDKWRNKEFENLSLYKELNNMVLTFQRTAKSYTQKIAVQHAIQTLEKFKSN